MNQDSNNNQKQPKLMDHNYDGIQEYDNSLPAWWLWTFFGTIIFSFIYYLHYNFGGGPTLAQELEVEMKALPAAAEKVWSETELEEKMKSPEAMAQGKTVFAGKCASCHGAKGEGLIGPNLTDKYWIHGQGHRIDLVQVITKGVTEKGMPSWVGMISDDEIIEVAGFVHSLAGTIVANGKAPQGVEVKE